MSNVFKIKLNISYENSEVHLSWNKNLGNIPLKYSVIRSLNNFNTYEVLTENLNETEFISDFSVYPNPATSESFELTWQSNSQKPISVAVTDVTGRELFRKTIPQTIGKNSTSIELPSAANGIYFLKATCEGGSVKQKKIILTRKQ